MLHTTHDDLALPICHMPLPRLNASAWGFLAGPERGRLHVHDVEVYGEPATRTLTVEHADTAIRCAVPLWDGRHQDDHEAHVPDALQWLGAGDPDAGRMVAYKAMRAYRKSLRATRGIFA